MDRLKVEVGQVSIFSSVFSSHSLTKRSLNQCFSYQNHAPGHEVPATLQIVVVVDRAAVEVAPDEAVVVRVVAAVVLQEAEALVTFHSLICP